MRENGLQQLLADLSSLWRIRHFEERVQELRAAGEIAGSVHLCNGQEAIYVSACSALDLRRDVVFPTYRGHGWAIACGAPLGGLFAELLGRATVTNGGRGGSAYLSAPDYGMYGENSIVGAGAPIAVGAALAATFDGSGRVAVAAFGVGAVNQGSVREALNFAAVYGLPVLFLIENNGYSELTPIASMVRSDRLYSRAGSYGIDGVCVDGNDVGKVRATVAEANVRYVSLGRLTAPLTMRTQQGATPGSCAQHSQSLGAFFAHVPGLRMCLPATPQDAYGLTLAAIACEDPAVVIESRALYHSLKEPVNLDAPWPAGLRETRPTVHNLRRAL